MHTAKNILITTNIAFALNVSKIHSSISCEIQNFIKCYISKFLL